MHDRRSVVVVIACPVRTLGSASGDPLDRSSPPMLLDSPDFESEILSKLVRLS